MLVIEGEVAPVRWEMNRKAIWSVGPDASDPERPKEVEVGRTQADAPDEVPPSSVVWALVVSQNPWRGLLLAHVHGDTYRRVGIFYRIWDVDSCGFMRRIVSIV
jgi:hypothetical protein